MSEKDIIDWKKLAYIYQFVNNDVVDIISTQDDRVVGGCNRKHKVVCVTGVVLDVIDIIYEENGGRFTGTDNVVGEEWGGLKRDVPNSM